LNIVLLYNASHLKIFLSKHCAFTRESNVTKSLQGILHPVKRTPVIHHNVTVCFKKSCVKGKGNLYNWLV